jgi:hypothetical protein
MTGEQTYSFVSGIFGRERTFRLGANALYWKDGRHSGSIDYADIATVHMYFTAQPFGYGTRICTIHTRAGARCELKSKSFRPWGRSEDRSIRYSSFVRELIDRVLFSAPGASIFDGPPNTVYYGQVVALVAVASIIIAELALAMTDWRTASGDPANSMIMIGFFTFPAIGLAKTVFRGTRRRLDPEKLSDVCGIVGEF